MKKYRVLLVLTLGLALLFATTQAFASSLHAPDAKKVHRPPIRPARRLLKRQMILPPNKPTIRMANMKTSRAR